MTKYDICTLLRKICLHLASVQAPITCVRCFKFVDYIFTRNNLKKNWKCTRAVKLTTVYFLSYMFRRLLIYVLSTLWTRTFVKILQIKFVAYRKRIASELLGPKGGWSLVKSLLFVGSHSGHAGIVCVKNAESFILEDRDPIRYQIRHSNWNAVCFLCDMSQLF